MENNEIQNNEIKEVKKAILPMAGLGSRFYPISKAVGKDLLPLVDRPMISYAVEEAKQAGIEEIILVVRENNKTAADYFRSDEKLEQFLEDRGAKEALENLREASAGLERINFSLVVQPSPKGDGDAVLRAEKKVGKEPFAVVFFDDIFIAKTPALTQLMNVFQTSQKIVIGLKKTSSEKLPFYGVVKADKIANNLYKIKDVVEKPAAGQAPSDLAICSRYILTEEIFPYLKKIPANAKGE
ncbi:MAG: sugar phosphate nucleotidyltransferase, partial [Patescibacteria group bacterium]